MYKYSREIRSLWLDNGKPRQGHLFTEYTRSKARFKYALKFIKRNEADMRKASLARKMSDLESNEFWKEIRAINNVKTPLPCSIEDSNGPKDIINLWEKHYHEIFNCLPKVSYG